MKFSWPWSKNLTHLDLYLQEIFQEHPLEFGVTANHSVFAQCLINRQWMIIDHKDQRWVWAMGLKSPHEMVVQCAKNEKVLFYETLNALEIQRRHHTYFHQCLALEIKRHQQQILKKVDIPTLAQNEAKSLEWIRVSFEVLKSAIKESRTNPNHLFQGQLFSGVRGGQTEQDQCRLIIYSLDQLWQFHDNGVLEIHSVNHKPQGLKEDRFSAELALTKAQAFDHLIKLFNEAGQDFTSWS
jgi:hypothetical protein